MKYNRLLAKSTRNPERPSAPETLPGHIATVGGVAAQIVRDRGATLLTSLGLPVEVWAAPLLAAVVRGALLHDIGKANADFQAMVRHETRMPQALRHEVVGLWIIAQQPTLNRWLFSDTAGPVRYAALRAVVGHHVKFGRFRSLVPGDTPSLALNIFTGHRDFKATLAVIGDILGLEPPPALGDLEISLLDKLGSADRLLRDADVWWKDSAEETHRFAAAVAALVVSADVCGSSVARGGGDPVAWARETLDATCGRAELHRAALRRLKGAEPRRFQHHVAASPTRLTLATAGCGSGKTVAAYMWAAQRLDGHKLFFCYPTTGTASEGFADYAFPEFEQDAALVHSRAAADIEHILDNGADDHSDDGRVEAPVSRAAQHALKQQGLDLWRARMTVCTADAVLGLVQNNRTGLFGFPAIAGAGFVFDEVHLYDNHMFGVLLAFLDAFRGVPILLMTATLQPGRRRALLELAERLGEKLKEVEGPPELEGLERYEIRATSQEEAFQEAIRVAKAGGRVLWVANTVNRAVEIAKQAAAEGVRVEPYHSRYRYLDRLDRHRTVVDLFKPEAPAGGVLAVTTQVCEVSLDISATLLVTELAPASALIQRLGRLNRWATPDATPGPLPALVVDPSDPLPYSADDFESGREWLRRVAGGPRSQRDLAAAFLDVLQGERVAERTPSPWLDDGWTIEPSSVRTGEPSITVVREEDAAECRDDDGRPIAAEITRYSIPMPFRAVARESGRWKPLGGALIAPRGSMTYQCSEEDGRWGARWAR